jgi:hypothetical protein
VPRVISSAQTFIAKFIAPVIVAAVLPHLFFSSGLWPIFLPFGVIAIWGVYWFYIRNKKVTIDDDGMVISNYAREVHVLWRDIGDALGSRWMNPRQVMILFDRDIGFGTSIVFMPKFRYLWPGKEHPIAQELRELIRENRGS